MLSLLKNYSVLYVEDEPEIQSNMREYLEGYFKEVYIASDGKEALRVYNEYKLDIAILDLELPHISGLSLAHTFRKENKEIKIIMLTAHSETEILLQAAELKLTKYLIKPISLKKFKNMLLQLKEELMLSSTDIVALPEGYQWNEKNNLLSQNNKPILLSEKEHRLFKLFMKKRCQTVTYMDIMITVWDDAYEREISIDSVKNRVSTLRKKLPKNLIVSVYGEGYIIH